LDTNTGAETPEEEDTEVSSPKGTPDQPKRGRKTEKKRREEQSYKEVVQGTQYTILEMVNTRSGVKLGKTPKGGLPPHPGK
jgi:2-methylcitrate dehydratase PrpD